MSGDRWVWISGLGVIVLVCVIWREGRRVGEERGDGSASVDGSVRDDHKESTFEGSNRDISSADKAMSRRKQAGSSHKGKRSSKTKHRHIAQLVYVI